MLYDPAENKAEEINEEMINEMCNFSNMSTANNVVKCSANGEAYKQGGKLEGKASTKEVFEDIDIDLDGEEGTDGKPRFREEIKLPPIYQDIYLFDPND